MRGRRSPFWKRVLPLPLMLPLSLPKTFIMAPDGHQRRRNRAGRLSPGSTETPRIEPIRGVSYAIQRNIWMKREPCAGPVQPCDTMPATQRRRPAIQTRRKVFSGWGRAREGEGQFLPKNAPPPLASLSLSPVQTGQALIVMPGGTTAKTSLQLVELVHGFASVGDIMHQDLALL